MKWVKVKEDDMIAYKCYAFALQDEVGNTFVLASFCVESYALYETAVTPVTVIIDNNVYETTIEKLNKMLREANLPELKNTGE